MSETTVEDLSQYHQPVSDLFRIPASTVEWQSYRLSPEKVAFFQENGYVVGNRALTDEQIESLRGELTGLLDPTHPGHSLFYEYHTNEAGEADRILFHALGAWRIMPGFHDILWNPAVTVPASQLLGGKSVRFWHDQLFCKPARHGGVVPWHQDYSYWTRTQPMAHLTCWIALDDSTLANGCVHYVPGSHRWNLLPEPEGRISAKMEAIQSVLSEEQQAAFKPVPVEVEKGMCIYHHGLTLHGSYQNSTDIPRRATVVNYFADGTRSASDSPLLQGTPVVPSGERMGGRFFPLLLDSGLLG